MSHVPEYVYFLFVALMYVGYKRCFPRVVKLQRLGIFPVLFILLSLRSMFELFQIDMNSFLVWGVGVAFGMFFGYLHIRKKKIIVDHHQKLLKIPGDWFMMLLIFSVFSFEFFVHYTVAVRSEITKISNFDTISIVFLGSIAGMAIGRNLTYVYKYITSPHQTIHLQN